jgi:hypothetical protein
VGLKIQSNPPYLSVSDRETSQSAYGLRVF